MSDKEFGAREFGLGTVVGYRAWEVNTLGRLVGYMSSEWHPGENRAVCHGSMPKGIVDERAEGESFGDWHERVRYSENEAKWKADHDLIDCRHGFYAYFGDQIGYHAKGDQKVVGIVEGFGEVLVGSKGFRAMKARILALSVENEADVWRLTDRVMERLRANYPVPVFESTLLMLSEYPTSLANEFAEVQA